MSSTLDLKITFEGDETILSEISKKLSDDNSGNSALCQALSSIVQQTLIAAGAPADFKVKIQRSDIKRDYGQSGGLNAQEWLETI